MLYILAIFLSIGGPPIADTADLFTFEQCATIAERLTAVTLSNGKEYEVADARCILHEQKS